MAHTQTLINSTNSVNRSIMAKVWQVILYLSLFHIAIIASSNFLVQIPLNLFGLHSTWGAFTFPFIFLATDLTVRLCGAPLARRIVFYSMFPALLISYLISILFRDGSWLGIGELFKFDLFVARIALASFSAYLIGQLMDILVFNRLRRHKTWWYAPGASAVFGNLVDTIAFFTIAFYGTTDPYLSEHLFEVATVDYAFKIAISTLFFLPLYKALLDWVYHQLNGRNLVFH